MPSLKSLRIATCRAACPACGCTRFDALASQDRYLMGLKTVGCMQCGLVQSNPRPTKDSLASFYVHHYRRFYQGVQEPDEAYVAQYNKDVRLRYTVDFLSQHALGDGACTLLDYGCGEGSLFIALRQSGFLGRLAGVEPNVEFGRFAAEHGNADIHATLSQVGMVDVVVVNHVLEHLLDPIGTLREMKEHLAEGGRLYIDVPDVEEYTSTGDMHIAHLLHFSTRTLQHVVEAAGYAVEICEKHAPPYHPRSVRLVARAAAGPAAALPTTPGGEAQAWHAVRRIQRSEWKWTLKRRLSSIPLARTLYRRLKAGRPDPQAPH